VSSLLASRDDAEDEAADGALDALASALAVRMDAGWKQAVLPIYQASREAKLAAFDRDPANTTARRDVREARHAVAQALRASGGGAVPATPTGRYWEEYGNTSYVAFAQVSVGATELGKLVAAYGEKTSALGATVVGMFPLVGWRHTKLERGAIVIGLASGPLQEVGLAEQYIVLSIDGRDVGDAPAFAKVAAAEHAQLADRGGTLRLKVQTPDPAPREFAATVRPAEPSGKPTGKHNPGGTQHAPPPGGVNVWDRYNNPRGSGRDDPTQ